MCVCVCDTARDVPCGRGLSIGAVALMAVSRQAALVWGRGEGDGEVALDGKVDADVMAAVVYSMTVRVFMGRSVCVRVCVLQGDEGADAG